MRTIGPGPVANKVATAATSVARKKPHDTSSSFVDNRPEAVEQAKRQELANGSAEVEHLRIIQTTANQQGSPEIRDQVIQCKFIPGSSYQYNGKLKRFPSKDPINGDQALVPNVIYDATERDKDTILLTSQGIPTQVNVTLGINQDAEFTRVAKEGDWQKQVRDILDSNQPEDDKMLALDRMYIRCQVFGNRARLRRIIIDERMLRDIKASGTRSEMYRHIRNYAAGQNIKPAIFAKTRYGEKRGAALISALTQLGAKYESLVFDMGLMHEMSRVEAFVEFVKKLREENNEPQDVWETSEQFRKSREKVTLYRGMNLTDAENAHIFAHGIDPAMFRYNKGEEVMHSLLAPDLGNIIGIPATTTATRHIRSGARPMDRADSIGVSGNPRKTFQNHISGGEDPVHSFSKVRAISELVATSPEMSGTPKDGQKMRLLKVSVPDIDVIKPELLPENQDEYNSTTDDLIKKMNKDKPQIAPNTPYSDIESLVFGRVFKHEIIDEEN